MKITTSLITLFSILALTACSQNPPTNPPKVDRLSLIRSMAYTHRHLLAQQLGPLTGEEGSGQVLLQSHCDLIRRGVVQTEPLPALCEPSVSHEAQACIARFHRCIGACGTFMKDCPVCEPKAARCLGKVDTGSEAGMTVGDKMDYSLTLPLSGRTEVRSALRLSGSEAGMTTEK